MRERTGVGLVTLLVCTAAAVTTEILPVGLLPSIARDLHVPESVAGLLVSVYAALVAVLAIPLTRLTVRAPRKTLLLATVVGYGASNLLVAVGPSFAFVAAGRALGGVAHALFFSVSTAYVTTLVPPARHGRAIAFVAAGAGLGYVAGVPLSTTLGAAFGWRISFAVIGGLALLLAVATAAVLPPSPRASPTHEAARDRGPIRLLVVVGAANVLGFLAHYSLYTYIAPLFIAAGVPEGAIGGTLFVLAVAGVLGLWAVGTQLDRRPRAVFACALIVAGLGVTLTGLLDSTPAGAIGGSIVWLVAFGAIPACFTAACVRTGAVSADLASAVNNTSSNIGIATGALLGGALIAGPGLGAIVVVSAATFAMTAAVVLAARRSFPART